MLGRVEDGSTRDRAAMWSQISQDVYKNLGGNLAQGARKVSLVPARNVL